MTSNTINHLNLLEVAEDIKNRYNNLVSNSMTSLAYSISTNLVVNTPVLSQLALYNWRVTQIGRKAEGKPHPRAYHRSSTPVNRKIPASRLPNNRIREPLQTEAIKEIRQRLVENIDFLDFRKIRIYNLAKGTRGNYYIGQLNRGKSPQAPVDFVGKVITDTLKMFKRQNLNKFINVDLSRRESRALAIQKTNVQISGLPVDTLF